MCFKIKSKLFTSYMSVLEKNLIFLTKEKHLGIGEQLFLVCRKFSWFMGDFVEPSTPDLFFTDSGDGIF